MLVAVEYLGSVDIGVTLPQFFRADNGKTYIVKLQNNRLGAKVLVSEILAAKFGELIGLCFPSSQIIEINEQLLQQNPILADFGATPGRHFASEYLDHAEYMGRHNLNKVTNISEMAGVMLFDHMFHNKDRTSHRKNLIIHQGEAGYKIYAIDNSHLFRSGKWTAESLNNLLLSLKVYYGYSFGLLLRDRLSAEDFSPYIDRIMKISSAEIDQLVSEIPAEWLPAEDERLLLAHFIKVRCSMVEQIYEELCRQIPRERGGHNWGHGRIIGSWKNKRQKEKPNHLEPEA